MDLEPCFIVYNLTVIQLNSTKLAQMINLKVVFHIVVSPIYKLDKICNLTQSPAQPENANQRECDCINDKSAKYWVGFYLNLFHREKGHVCFQNRLRQ